jgi:hypothetical protein
LSVAGDAVKNCYGVETTNLGIITDMALFIGYFVKMLTETTASLLQKRRATFLLIRHPAYGQVNERESGIRIRLKASNKVLSSARTAIMVPVRI